MLTLKLALHMRSSVVVMVFRVDSTVALTKALCLTCTYCFPRLWQALFCRTLNHNSTQLCW